MTALVSGNAETLDPTTERVLDAALEQFERDGIRRSSVEAIARRAGVTRVTVYRRFPRKDALVRAAVAREASRMIAEVDRRTSGIPDAEERTVESFVLLVELIRDHPLTRRLLATEPDSVLKALTVDAGPLVARGTEYIAAQIRRGQSDGSFSDYDPEPVAEILSRFAHSLVLTPRAVVDLDDANEAREFARAHVAPILKR
ncbi:MAG: TetR/AcrR family transcriptional regulator [Solirubrobacterales bacterium]